VSTPLSETALAGPAHRASIPQDTFPATPPFANRLVAQGACWAEVGDTPKRTVIYVTPGRGCCHFCPTP